MIELVVANYPDDKIHFTAYINPYGVNCIKDFGDRYKKRWIICMDDGKYLWTNDVGIQELIEKVA